MVAHEGELSLKGGMKGWPRAIPVLPMRPGGNGWEEDGGEEKETLEKHGGREWQRWASERASDVTPRRVLRYGEVSVVDEERFLRCIRAQEGGHVSQNGW